MKKYATLLVAVISIFWMMPLVNAQANKQTYLANIKTELQKPWPKNRTINLVFHGHSVPSGYGKTPEVNTLKAYPYLLLKELKSTYRNAVINIITTSIGGENSEQGAKRFKKDVLVHQPDVLFIDYALNDRAIGLKRSKTAMEQMIHIALKKKIKIILMTPSTDLNVDITQPDNILDQYTQMLYGLAKKYHIGIADSYAAFRQAALSGEHLSTYMAQSNHPNKKGHELIVAEILKWLK